ncbi:MAG: hypothetical protein WAK03_11340 [Methylocystis sp.]
MSGLAALGFEGRLRKPRVQHREPKPNQARRDRAHLAGVIVGPAATGAFLRLEGVSRRGSRACAQPRTREVQYSA